MEKRVGSSAGIVALVVLVLHTMGLLGSEGSETAKPKESVATRTAKGKAVSQTVDFNPPGPWRATKQYFHSEGNQLSDKACQAFLLGFNTDCAPNELRALYGFDPAVTKAKIQFLIATVRDPLHTRMALETDRDLDAMQEAAFRANWELATQWLPWYEKAAKTQADVPAGDVTAATESDLEKLPGLLVFRHHFTAGSDSNELLLAFIVGETPTAGLNGFQFESARATEKLLGDPEEVRIAGPNLSGSFPSFTRLLLEQPGTHRFRVRAGSVSNSDYAAEMLATLKEAGFELDTTTPGHPALDFHGSTFPSRSFHENFVTLARRLHLSPGQVAELNESQTGFSYGQPADNDPFPIPTFRYPRDIAQLRNSYNDAVFATAASPNVAISPSVDFSLKDTQAGEDTFPTFSTNHTPVSQNAEVDQIVGYLNRNSVRLVSLSASNVFDTLFLAKLLSRYCPDVRLVLRGPDLLFAEEAAHGSLAGVMAISPYPLFPEGSQLNFRDISTFASADQVGEYNAVLSLLNSGKPGSVDGSSQWTEYPPSQGKNNVGAWLLELGPSGWLPIDFIGQSNPRLNSLNGVLKGLVHNPLSWFSPKSGRKYQLPPLAKPKLSWNVLTLLVALLSLSFWGRLTYLRRNQSRLVWSSLCLIELNAARKRGSISDVAHSRYFCLFACFASLALMCGVVAVPMLAANFNRSWGAPALEILITVAFILCLLEALRLAFVIPLSIETASVNEDGQQRSPAAPLRKSRWALSLRAIVLIILFAAVGVWFSCCVSGPAGYFLCYRTLSLAAPICPLWPLILSAAGLFALAFFHLRRFAWCDQRQPNLNTSVFDNALSNEFQKLKNKLEGDLGCPFTVSVVHGTSAVALAAIVLSITFCLLLPVDSLKSFEPTAYSWVLAAQLLPLATFGITTFLRFKQCWSTFRAFLVSLNSVVLGGYFERIPEFGGSGPVWLRDVKLMSLSTAINSAIAIHNLQQTSCVGEKFGDEFRRDLVDFLGTKEGEETRQVFLDRYRKFRQTAAHITAELGEKIFIPYWKKHKLPFVGNTTPKAAPTDDSPKPPEDNPNPSPGDAVMSMQLRSFTGVGSDATRSFRLKTVTLTKPELRAHDAQTQDACAIVSGEAYECAAKFVAYQYSVFIGYILHHLQNLLMCCSVCSVLLVAALNSFSFQAPQSIFYLVAAALIGGTVVVIVILAQIEKDAILSRLSGSQEGELGKEFYIRAFTYGALPILGILSVQFPSITRFATAWLEPALSKLQ